MAGGEKNGAEADGADGSAMCGPRVHPRRRPAAPSLTRSHTHSLTHSDRPAALAPSHLETRAPRSRCGWKPQLISAGVTRPRFCPLRRSVVFCPGGQTAALPRRSSPASPLFDIYISTLLSALNSPIQDRTVIDGCIFRNTTARASARDARTNEQKSFFFSPPVKSW